MIESYTITGMSFRDNYAGYKITLCSYNTTGLGYSLVISALPSCRTKEVNALLADCAIIATPEYTSAFEMTYNLPVDSASKFPKLLYKMETYRERLRVVSYTLSSPSLKGVFMRYVTVFP